MQPSAGLSRALASASLRVGTARHCCTRLFRNTRAIASQGSDQATVLNRQSSDTSNTRHTEWVGLQAWRAKGVDSRRVWGAKEAEEGHADGWAASQTLQLPSSLAEAGALVLRTPDPRSKAGLTHRAWQAYNAAPGMPVGACKPPGRPARPVLPQLVPPREVPTAKASPLPMPVYMLHNLAHVELNAVDLAWDTVARFSGLGMPQQFFEDFGRVADDESRHLGWCLQRLQELGHAYGDMVAHSILWDGAVASAGDLPGRLAVVPMSQEARGLDAGARLKERLVGLGDNRSAAIVGRIAAEEKAHVAVGVKWMAHICERLGVDTGRAYQHYMRSLAQEEALRPPFNHQARAEVGLPQHWYDRSRWQEDPEQQAALHGLQARLAGMLATEVQAAA